MRISFFFFIFVIGKTFVPPGWRRDHTSWENRDTGGVLLHLEYFVPQGADGMSQAVSSPAPAPWTCPAMDATGK